MLRPTFPGDHGLRGHIFLTDYDGEVFNIALSEVPERKDDLVAGCYELPAPEGPTRVTVKVIDMLGEEVIVVKEV